MNDRITISITPELHSAIIIAAEEKNISVSRVIENFLRALQIFINLSIRQKNIPSLRKI
ncbi:DUF6364 family protein [Picrophilus oshimae]|uniref:Uncharacterized protein n=1 Tax=Picrophilus torridus (strain ATCC 700027 / DSM 9790 / JCM 10055 / NBRC 100828 / KAW 2/3) TaxID=1122961 RepID=A0A8G2FWA5_PICTO|nr:DUF6364 family protein [Picrophilus oshimae]SMD30646.1 hypothetical protein SAMN02745355_0538 [Picrophilus oshimae DSM 9789]